MRVPRARLTISGAMGVVLALAVGFAALRDANALWAGSLALLSCAVLGTAVLGVVHGRGQARARWLGVLLFCAGYLVLAFGPWFSEQVGPTLATTQLLDYAHMRVTSSPAPRSSKFRPLLAQRDALLDKLQHAMRVAKSQGDPSVVALRQKVTSLDAQIAAFQGFPLAKGASGAGGPPPAAPNRWQALVPGAANYDQFLRVGHYLSALFAGVGGAVISTHLYSRREHHPGPENGTSVL
jgi:hypothetical protein